MVYADLHVHTNHSDGTREIESVLKIAKENGIHTIAITDHDTINHLDEAEQLAKKIGVEVIRGVEMSCYDHDVGKKVHIVGLWLNKEAPHVAALCQNTLACRDAYHRKLIDELYQKGGYRIIYEEAKKFAPYNIVFKIHIFLALMKKYPEDMTFEKYRELFASKTSQETDDQMGYIDIKEGIEAIRKDGGITIIAHPCEYNNYNEIQKYVGYGLQGIEISHPSMKERDDLLTFGFAERLHLLRSGGSDFHDERLTKMGQYGLSEEEFKDLEWQMREVKGL